MSQSQECLQTSTIILNAQDTDDIKIAVSTANTVLEQLDGDVASGIESFGVQQIITDNNQTSSLSANHAIILNQETGELQLIQLAEAGEIGGEEIEVVTVDAERFTTSDLNISFTDREQVQYVPTAFKPQFIPGLSSSANHVAQISHLSTTPATNRMKSAPALLRNSRRVAYVNRPTVNVASPVNIYKPSINTPKTSNRKPKSPSLTQIRAKLQQQQQQQYQYATMVNNDSGQQILMVNPSQISHFMESPSPSGQSVQIKDIRDMIQFNVDSNKVAAQASNLQPQKQQAYYIYQDADGDQVAELVEDSNDVGLEPSKYVYRFENNAFYVNEDTSNYGSLSVPVQKGAKTSKKRPSKKTSTRTAATIDNSGKPKRSQTELKCLETGCATVAYNVSELRKHLTEAHDMLFDLESVIFPTEAEFKEWREQYERERMVSFIYRGGTKKIAKDQAVTYLICHRSGHYKPTMVDTNLRKRKMKPQGSCKIGGYCTAGIKLLKNLDTSEIRMDICHTHYGHPLDSEAIPHLRVNPMLRKIILKRFEEGMKFHDVLAYIHHNPDGLEGLRMVDRRAVRNIFDTWKNPVKRTSKSVNCKKNLSENSSEDIQIECNDNDSQFVATTSYLDTFEQKSVLGSSEDIIGDMVEGHLSSEITEKLLTHHQEAASEILYTDNSSGEVENPVKRFKIQDSEYIMVDETAPVLYSMDELQNQCHYGEIEQMDEDSSPPLLIAIDSVKSLRDVTPDQSSLQSESEKPKKGKKKSIVQPVEATYTKVTPSKVALKRKQKKNSNGAQNNVEEKDMVETENVKDINEEMLKPINANESELLTTSENNQQILTPDLELDSLQYHQSNSEDSDLDAFELSQIRISKELEAAIDKLHNHGESGPSLLLYKKIGDINVKYGGFCRAFHEDDFCLIIQTPVQRQILQMFPKIIGIDILDGPKPNEHDLKLGFVMVLDDFKEAIPVAWIIADTMCSRIFNQFFRILRYHCGELPTQYIMAPKNAEVYKTWISHFSNKPKMLQNEFCAKRDLRTLVNRHFPNDCTRTVTWTLIEDMLSEKSLTKLTELKSTLNRTVKQYINGPNFLKKFEKDWITRLEEWSTAHRILSTVNLLFVADGFTRLRKFVSFKGTRKLNQSVDHILKIGYDKCFLRTKRMFKGDQKFSNLLEKIEKYHIATKEIKDAVITQFEGESKWAIECDDGVCATVIHLNSPCDCKIVCKVCKICIHQYMCSCEDFWKEQVMCVHAHKVHCYVNDITDEEIPPPSTSEEIPEDVHQNTVNIVENDEIITDTKPEIDVCEETEITIVNEAEGLNISEVLEAAAGLLRRENGQEMPKIVSITDADTQKVIYDGSTSSGSIIFQFETE